MFGARGLLGWQEPDVDCLLSLALLVPYPFLLLAATNLCVWIDGLLSIFISAVMITEGRFTRIQTLDGVEGNGGSLKDRAEIFVLFLRGTRPVLMSSIYNIFSKYSVLMRWEHHIKYADIFRSVLSRDGESADGQQCCCCGAPSRSSWVAPAAPKKPFPLLLCCLRV